MNKKYAVLKLACYSTNVTMAIIGNVPPVLFITFKESFGISYSLLGFLVLVNFVTQLGIDLIFSFFSHKFNITKAVRLTPIIAIFGLLIFGVSPYFLSGFSTFWGLLTGTVIFSAASGFAEVLISPVIAAIPSDNPDREMSKLHSIYAWGVVGAVIFSTLFLMLVGTKYWQILIFILTLVPLLSAIAFRLSEIPAMQTPEKVSGVLEFLKKPTLWLCVAVIFLGGAAECTMAQWCSSYAEQALGLPKVVGDVFGVALFAVALGMGRTLYAKFGKNIAPILFFGSVGAVICYLTAAICPLPVVGLLACAFTGFFVSMLWPGSLIVAAERFPAGGVFIYAMMAAGGDLGASVGPQLVGIITDAAAKIPACTALASDMGVAPEQLGMKLGMIVGMLFPLIAVPLYFKVWKKYGRKTETEVDHE